jgi:hypothetical protein
MGRGSRRRASARFRLLWSFYYCQTADFYYSVFRDASRQDDQAESTEGERSSETHRYYSEGGDQERCSQANRYYSKSCNVYSEGGSLQDGGSEDYCKDCNAEADCYYSEGRSKSSVWLGDCARRRIDGRIRYSSNGKASDSKAKRYYASRSEGYRSSQEEHHRRQSNSAYTKGGQGSRPRSQANYYNSRRFYYNSTSRASQKH